MSSDSLPREVLKWLQSLDLSYSVKNVKRDFSNGFLVAEIFSRYYQNDIYMHSFDNGSSVKKKLDNWQLLNKFFVKHQVPLNDKALIEDVVHCKDKAGVKFVCAMYTTLTARSVPDMDSLRITAGDEVPYFARPTASNLIKANIKDSELTTTMKSHLGASTRATAVMDQHSANLRSERTQDPTRFSTQRNTVRGPPRKPTSEESSAPLIEFKEVSVKPVDRSVAQLRASKDLSGRMADSHHGDAAAVDASTAQEVLAHAQQGAHAPMVRSTAAVLEAVVAHVLAESPLLPTLQAAAKQKSMKDGGGAESESGLLGCFTDAVSNHDVAPHELVGFCDALLSNASEAQAVGEAMLRSPKDFWTFFSVFSTMLASTDAPGAIDALVQLVKCIGQQAVIRDPASSRGLFVEYALPLLLPMLQMPARRRPVLAGMYAFSENDVLTHARLIKTLQDSLSAEVGSFIHCAAILISLEGHFNDDLLDVYLYYAIMGTSMVEPSVRAAALSMLPAIVGQNHVLVLNMLGRLEPLVDDGWWEVQAQLLQACAALLTKVKGSEPAAARIYAIAESIITRYTSPNITKIGLSCLACCLAEHPPLCTAYVKRLLALPHHFRMNLLGPSAEVEPVQILGATATSYQIESLAAQWPSYVVAKSTVDHIIASELENLERAHVSVIYAAVHDAASTDAGDAGAVAMWGDLFVAMEAYFYVSLCDEELCQDTIGVFEVFLNLLPSDVVIQTFPTLLSSLVMVYPSGPETCRQQVSAFLESLYARGGDYAAEMRNLATSFPPEVKAAPELGTFVNY